MRDAVVLYESWFGSSRKVAERIAEGLRGSGVDAHATRLGQSDMTSIAADLLVIGGPTHAHGLSTRATRREAGNWADDPRKQMTLDEPPAPTGVREWLDAVESSTRQFAAFSTRADIAELLSGSAAHAIRRRLRAEGWHELAPTESFIVPPRGSISEGELDRAQDWGEALGYALETASAADTRIAR